MKIRLGLKICFSDSQQISIVRQCTEYRTILFTNLYFYFVPCQMTKAKKLAGAGDVVVHVQSSKKKGKKKKK